MKRSIDLPMICMVMVFILSPVVSGDVLASESSKEVVQLAAPEWLPGSPSVTDTVNGVVLHAQWTPVEGASEYVIYINDWVTLVTTKTHFSERRLLGNGQYKVRVEALIYDPGMKGVISSPGFINVTTERTLITHDPKNKRQIRNERRKEAKRKGRLAYNISIALVFFMWGLIVSKFGIKTRRNLFLAFVLPYPILTLILSPALFYYGWEVGFRILLIYVPPLILISIIGFRIGLLAKKYNPDL